MCRNDTLFLSKRKGKGSKSALMRLNKIHCEACKSHSYFCRWLRLCLWREDLVEHLPVELGWYRISVGHWCGVSFAKIFCFTAPHSCPLHINLSLGGMKGFPSFYNSIINWTLRKSRWRVNKLLKLPRATKLRPPTMRSMFFPFHFSFLFLFYFPLLINLMKKWGLLFISNMNKGSSWYHYVNLRIGEIKEKRKRSRIRERKRERE